MGNSALKVKNKSNHSFDLYDEFFLNFTSEHTRQNYRLDLDKFFNYLSEIHPKIKKLDKVERKQIIEYRNWLAEVGGRDGHPCAPKTIARRLASLSSYFDFLVEKGDCEFNPVSSVKRPRREVLKPTNALSREQVREMFEVIDLNTNSGPLHKALLLLFFTSGMRKSEVLHLKYKDYREINDYRVMEFRGKGGKIGQKLLHHECVDALEHYLSWMKSKGREHGPEDWLFQPTKNPTDPKNLNKPLNPKTINEILDQYAKKIGLNFKISPHSARATFIGELLEAGVDIYSVAREVSHSTVKTTQEYDKRRKRLIDSPVSKLKY